MFKYTRLAAMYKITNSGAARP